MGKRYLLIGASSGIGLQLAHQLMERGESVVALSRTRGELSEAVEHHTFDATNWEVEPPQLEGKFDGLAYLPGTINLAPFKQLSLDKFKNDLDLNYLGAVRAVKSYLPLLEGSPNSSIVLMSSVAAQLGMPFHTSISGAKGAVEGFAVALAAELAPKVRVNVVAPSLTDTPLAEQLLSSDTRREHAAKRHAMQRVGDARDIASGIAYLLSEESQWMTGQVLHVDGGMSTLRPI